ncbi:hypothetical protein GCM10010405_23280 [Streptomyces macrosporus]|uniref:Uncharacterized protein n=1 Tax=Streptomyces macrosporus TaxID=44032 RepID=A0ABN3JVU1_9ACTN
MSRIDRPWADIGTTIEQSHRVAARPPGDSDSGGGDGYRRLGAPPARSFDGTDRSERRPRAPWQNPHTGSAPPIPLPP